MNAHADGVHAMPGWSARLRLGFHQGGRRSELSERERFGPLSVQRPFYPEGKHCHVYILHPPGGVVGGDRLEIDVAANAGSGALITTPGAAKFYRSATSRAYQLQNLSVASGAVLEWLPQENIFFPGARVSLQTRVDLEQSSSFVWWEINCLGRPANNELFTYGELDSQFSLFRDDEPLLLERNRIDERTRHYPALTGGKPVVATFIISGCDEQALDECREAAEQLHSRDSTADLRRCLGITLIEDLLVARYLGDDTVKARQIFTQFWRQLRVRCIGLAPVTPRIWLT